MATKKETQVKEETTQVEAKEVKTVDAFEELVSFYALKDNGKYKDDLTVALNGKVWKIPRGKSVMIPKKIAIILEQSQDQDGKTADYIAEKGQKVTNDNFFG